MQRLKAELKYYCSHSVVLSKDTIFAKNTDLLQKKLISGKSRGLGTKSCIFSAKFQVFGIILTSFTQRVIYSLTARRTPKTRTQITINVDDAAIKLQTSVL